MSPRPSDDQPSPPVCGQQHPKAPVTCSHEPGHEDQHTHAGRDADGQLYEWESAEVDQ